MWKAKRNHASIQLGMTIQHPEDTTEQVVIYKPPVSWSVYSSG